MPAGKASAAIGSRRNKARRTVQVSFLEVVAELEPQFSPFKFSERTGTARARRAEELRLVGYSGPPPFCSIVDGRPREDRIGFAVQALRPVGINARIAALDAREPARRDAIGKACAEFELQL